MSEYKFIKSGTLPQMPEMPTAGKTSPSNAHLMLRTRWGESNTSASADVLSGDIWLVIRLPG